MLLRPTHYLSHAELAHLFQDQPVISGHYAVRVVLNTHGDVVEFVRVQRAEFDHSAMRAGSEPYAMPEGGYSVNAWLVVDTRAQHPGVLRLAPNLVVLPAGDYITNLSVAKRLCFPISGVLSPRPDYFERVGMVRLDPEGDTVESFLVGDRVSPDALADTLSKAGDLTPDDRTFPAIIGTKHAYILSLPILTN